MKRAISILVVLAVFISTMALPAQGAQIPDVTPQYLYTDDYSVLLTISENGTATIHLFLKAHPTVTEIRCETQLERKISDKWYPIYIGTTPARWEYTTTSRFVSQEYTAQLSSNGTYRVVARITFISSTVEAIALTSQATY